MKQFGKLSKRRFTPPKQNRGGGFQPNKKQESPLSGKVQGMKAAQGEERFCRALDVGIGKGLVREHKFRWTTLKRGVVGYKELDSLVFLTNGRVLAVSIKGTSFVHHGSRAMEQDKINEALQIATLKKMGYEVNEITSISADKLNTQEDANKEAKKIGAYR